MNGEGCKIKDVDAKLEESFVNIEITNFARSCKKNL